MMIISEEGLRNYKELLNDQLSAAQAVQQITQAKKSSAYVNKETFNEQKDAANQTVANYFRGNRNASLEDYNYAKQYRELSLQAAEIAEKSAIQNAIKTKIKDNGEKSEYEVSDSYLESISTMLADAYEQTADNAKNEIGS